MCLNLSKGQYAINETDHEDLPCATCDNVQGNVALKNGIASQYCRGELTKKPLSAEL